MEKYSLVGIDGNAFAIMGYTAKAMRREGFGSDVIAEMRERAMQGDYWHLIAVCDEYIRMVNESLGDSEEDDYE